MAKISFDRLVPLLTKQGPFDGVVGMLREIIVLQAKLDNLSGQDFYVQKGKGSHVKHLAALKRQYAQIIEMVNTNSVDYFLEEIGQAKDELLWVCSPESPYPIFAKRIVHASLHAKIGCLNDFLYIKGKFGRLKNLEKVSEDKGILMEVFSHL